METISGEGEGKAYDGGRPDAWVFNGRNRQSEHVFKGWSDCGCKAGFDGGIVLDPFMGSGTVGVVARKNSRNFIGLELNKEYCKIADKRLRPFLEQMKLSEVI